MQARRKKIARPTVEELDSEISRRKNRGRAWGAFQITMYSLVVVAALSLIVATSVIPVMRVYGNSMEPTFHPGQVLLATKLGDLEQGDLIAFYHNNQVLLKRVIATEGDIVMITEKGDVYVNNILLEEPYVQEKHFGISDITFPVKVPEDSFFVMGDQRESAIDSRSSEIGMVPREDVIGRIFLRVWPLKSWTVFE